MHQLWRSELKKFIFILLINSVLCVAIIGIMYYYGAPLIYGCLRSLPLVADASGRR